LWYLTKMISQESIDTHTVERIFNVNQLFHLLHLFMMQLT